MTFVHFKMLVSPKHIPSTHHYLKQGLTFEALLSHYVHLQYSKQFGYEEESKLILKQLMIFLLRDDQKVKKGDKQKGGNRIRYRILEIAHTIKIGRASCRERG